jgi:hypothetical protein
MRAHGIRILSFDARIQLLVVLLVAFPFSARAGDCGMPTPDYKAERTVTVGDSNERMMVYVSGALVREERGSPNRLSVTIRDMQRGRVVVFDPHSGHAKVLRLPPRPTGSPTTRTLDEVGPDGSRVHAVQFQHGTDWLDVSRTRCRPDGIMARQTFISVDPRGHEVEGTVTQDRIEVGQLSPDLFRLPPTAMLDPD